MQPPEAGCGRATAIAKYYGLKLKSETPDTEPTTEPTTEPDSDTGSWQEENGYYYYVNSDGSRAGAGWLKLKMESIIWTRTVSARRA